MNTLIVKSTEVCLWVSQAAASPSPSAFIASTLCIAIFGSDEDPTQSP
jgi:hypothetical protein